ncbi:DUF480 domain-containing protein [Erwinia sp. MMLR14_017]|uniref:DUF480 domain-containing protein n=1 Tax=Erwinia sp. MMLR14_017 TaxID=3093842 RepID=UPI00298F861D|nr:DUF480 domain-containing protein [Erwinia sp. MMLR14_017]MDW8846661.1 DUF480 domain-containing protein [Erwinia sp. MMLR14_017]
MKILLSALEARTVGCLLEKQVTTPEQYPMSLNGVVTACNQKSNREPVLSLSDSAVQNTLDALVKKHLVTSQSGFGNRVVKYEHRFCNTEFGQLRFSAGELALITTLLLRGAQTPGELRTRSTRLHEFADMNEVEQALETLASREDGPFVVRLARESGKRESRYMHLFSGEVDEAASPVAESTQESDDLSARVAELEREMAQIKQQLAQLSGSV